jgi:hypothetical protein
MFCRNFAIRGLKRYYILQDMKKAKKWPNHFISGKLFQKRPTGNPVKNGPCLQLKQRGGFIIVIVQCTNGVPRNLEMGCLTQKALISGLCFTKE